jgi:phosphoribosylanthranilate isomerase
MLRNQPTTKMADEIPFIIKVCGITTEDDLETSVEAGANAIGFNFYSKSPRFLTTARARQLAQLLPGAYIKVGVFVNPSEDDLLEIASHVPLDVLQLHGDKVPQHLANSFRVWKSAHATIDRTSLDPAVEAWLLDTPTEQHGGSGKTYDWSLAADFPGRAIVAGGLDGDNVATAIRTANPWGVDACSRLESKPGEKDQLRIKHFVENALAAFRLQTSLHSEMHS